MLVLRFVRRKLPNPQHKKNMIKFKKNDLLLVTALLALCVVLSFVCLLGKKEGNTAAVIYGGEEIASFPLSKDTTHPIKSDEGENTLVVENGFAHIESASCPDKICVHHKKIQNVGETIVCLPNKVVVEIREEK